MKLLPIGQTALLEIDGAEPPVRLSGLVQESRIDECVLSLPGLLEEGPPAALQPGAGVTLRFASAVGQHQARCTILSMSRSPRLELTLGEFHSERTFQRRNFARASASLPAEIVIVAAKDAKSGASDKRAVTLDVSGGGLRVDTVLPLAPEDRLHAKVLVPQRLQRALPPMLGSDATVMRVDRVVRGGVDIHRVGLQFSVHRDAERDLWVRLAMDLQRRAHLD